MEGEVRYCTTEDGVRIAYCVEGEGPPLLFLHHVYSFSLSQMVPALHEAIKEIGRGRKLIRYDVRGTGLSQRHADDLSPEILLRDMDAVVAALSLQRFTVLGAAVGGLRAIDYTARHPEHVEGLVLYEAFPKLSDVFPSPVLAALAQLARANWQLATRTLVDAGVRRQDEQEGLRWAQMFEDSTSGENFAQFTDTHAEHDVSPHLSSIQCPTLICHTRHDRLYPFSLAQRMAEAIPGARLVPLEDEIGGPFTNPGAAVEAMAKFLTPPLPASLGPAEGPSPNVLTPREVEILRLIAAGRTSSEISRELSLSIRTVGRHITNVYNKIGARGRADATAYALRHRIVTE